MKIFKNVSLKEYNTFGIDHKADTLVVVNSEEETVKFFTEERNPDDLIMVIGGGSNILFTTDFHGTIVNPSIEGISIEKMHADGIIVSAGAGINWDYLVEWTVEKGFGGLENLSLIPGHVGATPVQNIGAYGVEVKNFIYKVRAINISDGSIREFTNEECMFGYRDSIFKNSLKGKYLITRVFYTLNLYPEYCLDYGSLKDEVGKLGGLSLNNVRQAVINIRTSKLPDPKITGNAGSFFKNPVIESTVVAELKQKYPAMPVFPDNESHAKIAAGWLIEQCGWKGKKQGNAAVHDKQALVLINSGNATGQEILELSEKIRKSVYETFGIDLQREVEVLGEPI